MQVINATDKSFDNDVIDDRIVLVDFWATWCAPCKALSPVLDNLAVEYMDKVKIIKVNVPECPKIAAMRYKIKSLPTLAIFKNGEIQKQYIGSITIKQLKEFIGIA